jgi:IS30 family transposase
MRAGTRRPDSGRAGLTLGQLAELWVRWKAGESMTEMGRHFDKNPGTVFKILRRAGGIARPPRRRRPDALTDAEREEISRGVAAEDSTRAIARALGRPPSTVSRELARNGGRAHYRAVEAERRAWECAQRPKPCRLAQCPRLARVVAAQLDQRWSPEQIAGWLRRQFPEDPTMHVSPETIYRTLYIQARGVFKREVLQALRRARPFRRSRRYASAAQPRGPLTEVVPISARPPSVEDRAVPGHWEGDLLAGAKNTHIATLVERHSRFVQLVKVRGKDTHSVLGALTTHVQRLPEGLMASLTWDRGAEMSAHRRFTIATDVQVYICDPHSPWQRGTNENTNGLLRQYLPKGMDLSSVSQRDLDAIALALNTRPRKTLGFATPAEHLAVSVALTD